MKKLITTCLLATMSIGLLSGCKKLEDPSATTGPSTFGNVTVATETSDTSPETIETQPKYVEEPTEYIHALLNNFPRPGEETLNVFDQITATMRNKDCSWQVYKNNTAISFNFNSDINANKPMLDRIEYIGYNIDITDNKNPILNCSAESVVGAIYIICGTDEATANTFYDSACQCISNIYPIEATTDSQTGYRSYIINGEDGTPVANVTLEYPNENVKTYILTISVKKDF